MTVAIVLLSAVTAVLTILVVSLLRSQTEILTRLHDLGGSLDGDQDSPPPSAGDRNSSRGAADIAGLTPRGDAASVRVTGVDHDTILAFLSSNCITCQTFWDGFRKPRKLGLPDDTSLVVVTKGSEAESTSAVARLAPSALPTIMSSQAFDDYDVPGSPYFVRIHGRSGQVRSQGTGDNWNHVSALLAQTTSGSGTD